MSVGSLVAEKNDEGLFVLLEIFSSAKIFATNHKRLLVLAIFGQACDMLVT